MHLTKLERLMLLNQYEILKRLDPKGAEYYEQSITVLTKGFKVFYPEVAGFLRDDMPEIDGIFVREVLHMFQIIEMYKRDNPLDEEVIKDHFGRFAGFDSNHEGECLAFTKFLIDVRGEWAEQKQYEKDTDGFNSHWPMKDIYSRMLDAWTSLGKPVSLSSEQIRAILQAAPDPDPQRRQIPTQPMK